MARKFLDDIRVEYPEKWVGKDDARRASWEEEREVYGFDSRDTWSLDNVMLQLLFERLSLFLIKAEPVIDLTYHKFTIEGEELTQREAILKLLADIEAYLKDEDEELPSDFAPNIWRNYATISPAMWW